MKKTKGRKVRNVKGIGNKAVPCHAGCKCGAETCTITESAKLLKSELDCSHGRFTYAEAQAVVGHVKENGDYFAERKVYFFLDELTEPLYYELLKSGNIPTIVLPRSGEIVRGVGTRCFGSADLAIISCLRMDGYGLTFHSPEYQWLLQHLLYTRNIGRETIFLAVKTDAPYVFAPSHCRYDLRVFDSVTPAEGMFEWGRADDTANASL